MQQNHPKISENSSTIFSFRESVLKKKTSFRDSAVDSKIFGNENQIGAAPILLRIILISYGFYFLRRETWKLESNFHSTSNNLLLLFEEKNTKTHQGNFGPLKPKI